MNDWKLVGRSEDDLENEIKIVKAISKDVNMNFGLEKCARICFKKKVRPKTYYIPDGHLRRALNNCAREKHIFI